MIRKVFVSTMCLLLLPIFGFSQEVWDLQKCIKTAIDNNLTLKNAALTKESAAIDLTQAKHGQYPNLSGSSGTFLNFGRTIDPTSNQFIAANFFSNNYSVNTGILLFNGFRLRNQIKQSELSFQSAMLDQEQTIRNITLDVATAYLNALFAKERINVAQSNLAISEQQLNQTQKLIDAGNSAPNEIFNIQSLFAQNNQALVAARNDYTLGLLQLKQLMNISVETNFEVGANANVDNLTDPLSVELSTLMSRGSSNQPSLKARQIDVLAAEKGTDIAKARYYPTINLGGSLSTNYSNQGRIVTGFNTEISSQTVIFQNNPVTIGFQNQVPIFADKPYFSQLKDNLSYGFGLNISIPILSNYQIKGGVERAKINVERAEIALKQEQLTINSNIQRAYADAINARTSLDAIKATLDSEKNAYDAASKRFEIGAVNSFDLTNAKTRLDIANTNYLNAKYEYIFRSKLLDFYLGNEIKLN
ncbi:MAG: TolC family protein [Saprospiraceae bacterium]|nr:TolC family protein [Saprospiraceae bacterium]HMS67718.1 TolC family protein [Saprospiraceae bacterium]